MQRSRRSRTILFLSTLSLRRATRQQNGPFCYSGFLSTLSLRRATTSLVVIGTNCVFLSTLSLRRATAVIKNRTAFSVFLSTLSLRRATIHFVHLQISMNNFYPRSPCGERLKRSRRATSRRLFLSTLSLRRATVCFAAGLVGIVISIHALLAESDLELLTERLCNSVISIHALLAESDLFLRCGPMTRRYFYPRSPCGERRVVLSNYSGRIIFLSTLSLRRATITEGSICFDSSISIHALLAESDSTAFAW